MGERDQACRAGRRHLGSALGSSAQGILYMSGPPLDSMHAHSRAIQAYRRLLLRLDAGILRGVRVRACTHAQSQAQAANLLAQLVLQPVHLIRGGIVRLGVQE